MKSTAILIFSVLGIVAGCSSGDISKRSDYSDSHFDPLKPQVQDRAKYLRSLNPQLTQEEALNQASRQLADERRKEKKKQRDAEKQTEFEKALARSQKSQE